MIRFSCPGCEATFNVSDDKSGKTGKCPKCGSQFTIPQAADAPPPTPAPPTTAPLPDSGAVEIDPCPKCGARLSVEAGDIGLDVECPSCRAVYPAEAAAAVQPRRSGTGSKSSVNVGSGQKKPLMVSEDDDDDRPRRRREESRDDDDDDRPSRRDSRDRRDDDEDDERPRKKKKKKRRGADVESKRVVAAILALLLGAYGVHKFYLGYTGAGIIQLVVTIFTCGLGSIIPLIEFVIYVTRSDEDFIEIYQVGQKEWF